MTLDPWNFCAANFLRSGKFWGGDSCRWCDGIDTLEFSYLGLDTAGWGWEKDGILFEMSLEHIEAVEQQDCDPCPEYACCEEYAYKLCVPPFQYLWQVKVNRYPLQKMYKVLSVNCKVYRDPGYFNQGLLPKISSLSGGCLKKA